MSIFSKSSIHIGKMKLFFEVLRRNYCDMAQYKNTYKETVPLLDKILNHHMDNIHRSMVV